MPPCPHPTGYQGGGDGGGGGGAARDGGATCRGCTGRLLCHPGRPSIHTGEGHQRGDGRLRLGCGPPAHAPGWRGSPVFWGQRDWRGACSSEPHGPIHFTLQLQLYPTSPALLFTHPQARPLSLLPAVKGVLIGKVPDRGGRPEGRKREADMPAWTARKVGCCPPPHPTPAPQQPRQRSRSTWQCAACWRCSGPARLGPIAVATPAGSGGARGAWCRVEARRPAPRGICPQPGRHAGQGGFGVKNEQALAASLSLLKTSAAKSRCVL